MKKSLDPTRLTRVCKANILGKETPKRFLNSESPNCQAPKSPKDTICVLENLKRSLEAGILTIQRDTCRFLLLENRGETLFGDWGQETKNDGDRHFPSCFRIFPLTSRFFHCIFQPFSLCQQDCLMFFWTSIDLLVFQSSAVNLEVHQLPTWHSHPVIPKAKNHHGKA